MDSVLSLRASPFAVVIRESSALEIIREATCASSYACPPQRAEAAGLRAFDFPPAASRFARSRSIRLTTFSCVH
jgi:hypothetical protein